MQQYTERLIMTKCSITNSCFHIWCKFCFPRYDVLTVVLMRIWVCCTVTLLSGSHHFKGPYYLRLPRLSPVAWHEPFTQWHSLTSQTTQILIFYTDSKYTNIKFCIQFWILNRIQNIPWDNKHSQNSNNLLACISFILSAKNTIINIRSKQME